MRIGMQKIQFVSLLPKVKLFHISGINPYLVYCFKSKNFFQDSGTTPSVLVEYLNLKCICCKFVSQYNRIAEHQNFNDMSQLESKIQKDIMEAMKAKDATRLSAVRSIKSAILLARTAEGGSKELEDADIIKLIQKLSKQRKESAEQYAAAGRQELADNELAEEKVLAEYLPKMLSEEKVEEKIREIIAQVGASSPSDMGKVMGVATKALAGLAEGRTISAIVRKLLAK